MRYLSEYNSFKKIEDYLTPDQIDRAETWYADHKDHVDKIVIDIYIAYPPTEPYDKNNPKVWKPNYWKWFLENSNVNEKWYHNVLAGLILLTNIGGAYSQKLSTVNDKDKIELNSSEDDVLRDIKILIDYVKSNKGEYKNSKQVIAQLDKLISQYKRGRLDADSMSEIASQFVKNTKEMKNPVVWTKKQDAKQDISDSYELVKSINSYDTLITNYSPNEVYINIYEKGFFESGAFDLKDSILTKTVNDTISYFHKKGYHLENVIIESSTDGQRISNNLRQKLEQQGYKGSNEGLSEIRNDKMVDILTNIDQNLISQSIQWTDNEDQINEGLRYNRVVLKLVKTKAVKPNVEIKIETANIYYKITDYNNQAKIDKNLHQFNLLRKIKGNKKVKLDPNRHKYCFFIK